MPPASSSHSPHPPPIGLPASSSTGPPTTAPAPSGGPSATPLGNPEGGPKKKRNRRQKVGKSHQTPNGGAGSSGAGDAAGGGGGGASSSSSSALAEGPTNSSTFAPNGKRKRSRLSTSHPPSDLDSSDNSVGSEAGSSSGELTSLDAGGRKGKGKARDEGGRRLSKRSRSSFSPVNDDTATVGEDVGVPFVDGASSSTSLAGEVTRSRFFGGNASSSTSASRSRPKPVAVPSATGDNDDELEVDDSLHAPRANKVLSALELGRRTVASPVKVGRPTQAATVASSSSRALSAPTVSPLAKSNPPVKNRPHLSPPKPTPSAGHSTTALASPSFASAPAKVDPALRERAVRLKLAEDLEKEKRAREEEVVSLRAEMEGLRKQVNFKNSELMGEKGTLMTVHKSLTCNICMELLYQPFLISPCGHSACFACLKSWFLNPAPLPDDEPPLPLNLALKTCPTCRGPVQTPPTPIYVLKDLVHSIGPSLRLMAGEDPEYEFKDVLAEAGLEGRDIWDGLFEGRQAGEGRRKPVFDEADRIWRCPDCMMELYDGQCDQCGELYDDTDIGPGVHEDRSSDDTDDDDDRVVYPLSVPHFFIDDDDRSEQDSYEEDSFLEGDDDGYQNCYNVDESIMEQGAPFHMIEEFRLTRLLDGTITGAIETTDQDHEIKLHFPPGQVFDVDDDDRFGCRWMENYLSNDYELGPLWLAEIQARLHPAQRQPNQPQWYFDPRLGLDDDSYGDDDDGLHQADFSDGPSPPSPIASEDIGRERAIYARPRSFGRRRRSTVGAAWTPSESSGSEEDEDDLAQYGEDLEDEPEALVTDANAEEDEEDVSFQPRRSRRGRGPILSASDASGDDLNDDDDDDDDEDDEDSSGSEPNGPTTSRHFALSRSVVGRKLRLASSSAPHPSDDSSHAGDKRYHSIDEGSDGDPETRSPSLVDDDEDLGRRADEEGDESGGSFIYASESEDGYGDS